MDAKELDGLLSGVPVEIARSAWGKDAITFLQSFYRLLAATEGSTDEIVWKLWSSASRPIHLRAAATFVAMRAAKEKAEAERDELKRHAEAMAEWIDEYAPQGIGIPCLDAYHAAQEKKP